MMNRRNLPKNKIKLIAASTKEPILNGDKDIDEREKGSNEMTAWRSGTCVVLWKIPTAKTSCIDHYG